jgi:hypothetical protein
VLLFLPPKKENKRKRFYLQKAEARRENFILQFHRGNAKVNPKRREIGKKKHRRMKHTHRSREIRKLNDRWWLSIPTTTEGSRSREKRAIIDFRNHHSR